MQKVKRAKIEKEISCSSSSLEASINSVQTIICTKKMTDEDAQSKRGDYFDNSNNDFIVINSDADGFYDDDQTKPLFVFRKNAIPLNYFENALNAFEKAATVSWNRGDASGAIDEDRMPNNFASRRPMKDTEKGKKDEKCFTYYKTTSGTESKVQISNSSNSGLVGYYEKARGLPCRMTAFTKTHLTKFSSGKPLFEEAGKLYKTFAPAHYARQLAACLKAPSFHIENTPFSTITVNRNFRTAMHRDRGDFKQGLSILLVAERKDEDHAEFTGGQLCLPQFKIAFNVRHGDFFCFNADEWHCNFPLQSVDGTHVRLSFVCYLRTSITRLCQEKITED